MDKEKKAKLPRVVSKKQLYSALELVYVNRSSGRTRYRHRSIRRDFFSDEYLEKLKLKREDWNKMRTIPYQCFRQIAQDFDLTSEDFK